MPSGDPSQVGFLQAMFGGPEPLGTFVISAAAQLCRFTGWIQALRSLLDRGADREVPMEVHFYIVFDIS